MQTFEIQITIGTNITVNFKLAHSNKTKEEFEKDVKLAIKSTCDALNLDIVPDKRFTTESLMENVNKILIEDFGYSQHKSYILKFELHDFFSFDSGLIFDEKEFVKTCKDKVIRNYSDLNAFINQDSLVKIIKYNKNLIDFTIKNKMLSFKKSIPDDLMQIHIKHFVGKEEDDIQDFWDSLDFNIKKQIFMANITETSISKSIEKIKEILTPFIN